MARENSKNHLGTLQLFAHVFGLESVQTEADAYELADILLKINPDNDADAVEEQSTKLLLVSLILSASSQESNCAQFFLERLQESDPKDWLTSFQGTAKDTLEEQLSIMPENYRRMIGQQLYVRIGTYVRGQSLRWT